MTKKTVFITGVTGSMGGAGLNELLRRRDRFDLVTLVRPSAVNKKNCVSCSKSPDFALYGEISPVMRMSLPASLGPILCCTRRR
jgi:thioester reductase-like protein